MTDGSCGVGSCLFSISHRRCLAIPNRRYVLNKITPARTIMRLNPKGTDLLIYDREIAKVERYRVLLFGEHRRLFLST